MPGAAAVVGAVNNALSVTPAHVHQSIHGKNSVREAIDASGLLDGMDPAYAAEARAVLDALSPAHNHAILQALEQALSEGQTVLVEWALAEAISVDVASGADGVRITLRTKDGREYLGS